MYPVMPFSEIRQRSVGVAIAYFFPWVAVLAVLRFWVGYAPWMAGDTVAGMFGFGLTWSTFDPPTTFHVPIVVSSQLAAIAYLLSQQTSDLRSFHDTALILQIGLLALASAWFGWALARLNVSWTVAFICGVAAVSMPTASLTATAFTGYGPIVLWMGPGVTVLAIAILQGRQAEIEARSALTIIGFVAANIYSALPLALAAVAAVLMSAGPDFMQRFGTAPRDSRFNWIRTALLATALQSLIFGSMENVLHRGTKLHVAAAVIAAVIAAVVALLWHKRRPCFSVIGGIEAVVVTPLLVGWLVGCNVWAPLWFWNALYAFQSRGSAKEYADPFSGLANLPSMAAAAPWLLLVVGAVLIGLFLVMLALLGFGDASVSRRMRWLAIAFLILFPVIAFVPLAGDLLSASSSSVEMPITLRYLVPLIGSVAAAWALIGYDAGSVRAAAAVFISVAVLCAGLVDYGPAARIARLALDREAQAADAAIDTFLTAHPTARVVCLRTEMPGRCGLLYGYYYTFRSDRSRVRLPVPAVGGGRIEFSAPCYSPQPDDPICRQLVDAKTASGHPTLFVAQPWSGPMNPLCRGFGSPGQALRLIECFPNRE